MASFSVSTVGLVGGVVPGAVAAVIAAVVRGPFAPPQARVSLPLAGRLAVELVLFGPAALGLILVGRYLLGVLLFGLAIVDRALVRARDHDERLRENFRTR